MACICILYHFSTFEPLHLLVSLLLLFLPSDIHIPELHFFSSLTLRFSLATLTIYSYAHHPFNHTSQDFFTHLTYILFIYMFFVCGVHMCIWMLLCTHSYTWRWVGVLTCATTCESQRLTSSVFLNSFSSIFIIYGESLTWTQRPLAQLA